MLTAMQPAEQQPVNRTLRALYVTRKFNPVSVAIRIANPVSITKIAPASHVICVDGDYAIEANMLHGVRRVPLKEALGTAKIVADISYSVPDADAGLTWLRSEAARNAPYDWKGAFGLGLAPDRNWQNPEDWFCFELFAAGMCKSGRTVFRDNAHVNAYMLMSLLP
jgi:hypothetical protein